jgi:hypothetical protein
VSQCIAVDNDGQELTFDPASPGTATSTTIDGANALNGVACMSASDCVAADGAGRAIQGDPNSGIWTVEPILGANAFHSVSCSSSQCVAVDAAGDVVVGTSGSGSVYAPVNTSPPTISGADKQGQTLTETNGSWSNSPTSCSYQWEDCNAAGSSCTVIGGATDQTYELASTDVGNTIRVLEAAINAGGTAAPASSAATTVVQAASQPATAPTNTSPPAISGPTTVAEKLTASQGEWSGTAPISYAYYWQVCTSSCATIPGATGSSFTVVPADVGANLRAVVTATNAAGSSGAESALLGPVADPSGAVAEPKIYAASLTGVRSRKAKLSFTLAAAANAPMIKTISVSVPNRWGFVKSAKRLTGAVVVKGFRDRKLKFTAGLHAGTLTITLKTSAPTATVTISSGGISVTKALAGSVRDGKTEKLTALVMATNAMNAPTRLQLHLRV